MAIKSREAIASRVVNGVLERSRAGVAPAKCRAYIEEGQVLLLKPMGDGVSFCRR